MAGGGMGRRGHYRLLGKLGPNQRLASVSEGAALLWFLALPHTDREGRVAGDPSLMLDEYASAHARKRGWDEDTVREFTQELVAAGLWRTWEVDGVLVILFERFKDHQHPSRLAKESPSDLPDEPGNPIQSNRTQSNPIKSDTKSYESVRNRTKVKSPDRGRRGEIMRAYQPHHEDHYGKPWVPSVSDHEQLDRYQTEAALDGFDLPAEFGAWRKRCEAETLTFSLKGCLSMLGRVRESKPPNVGPVLPDLSGGGGMFGDDRTRCWKCRKCSLWSPYPGACLDCKVELDLVRLTEEEMAPEQMMYYGREEMADDGWEPPAARRE